MTKNKSAVYTSAIFILVIITPYLLANFFHGKHYIFTGFLLNPLDGYSYLAKMEQGYLGYWKFHLPFTANPGEGAYLFLFYLLLGHIARFVHLPNIIVFHSARILCSIIFLIGLYNFINHVFENGNTKPGKAFLIVLSGSGMGWILLGFGIIPPDFWVAEAYPFISCFENPHFPLGLGLMLFIFLNAIKDGSKLSKAYTIFLSIFLSNILPFGMVIVICVLMLYDLGNYYEKSQKPLVSPTVVISGLPFLTYQSWIVYKDPIISNWNSQNITPSPPLIQLFLAFSPALIAAIIYVFNSNKQNTTQLTKITFYWFISSLILVFIPVNLQRRFVTGLFIPIGILAFFSLDLLGEYKSRIKTILRGIFWVILPISNLIVITIIIIGIISKSTKLYMTNGEGQVYAWIKNHTEQDDLILANPDIGAKIPALTGRRVLYGHPFETVNAEAEEKNLERIFSENSELNQIQEFVVDRNIDLVIVLTGESLDKRLSESYDTVYSNEEYRIFYFPNQKIN